MAPTTAIDAGARAGSDLVSPAGEVWREEASGSAGSPAGTDGIRPELPGRLQGEYVVERALGHGSLGAVFLACSPVSGRRVAVRIFADWLAADEVARGRFLRAAELGLRLSHPNVVRLFEAGVDGCPYALTEHVEGESLADRLSRGDRFSAAEMLTLATHLAAGLAHAHASGVVHGALDPHRVVLGRDGVARICDFGFTALQSAPSGHAEFDRQRSRPAGDVYGLGSMLRHAGGDQLPAGLSAVVDAALAHPCVRPSAFDVFHQVLTVTSPPGVWLPGALTSTSSATTDP
jgi:serine/threonine protein kinase